MSTDPVPAVLRDPGGDAARLTSESDLRTRYRAPYPGAIEKAIDHVDDGAASFLAATTLVVLATTGPDGADASPRGGPPGFVRVLDRSRVALGDLSGNNRLDSFTNLTTHAHVGVLGIVAGVEEVLRLNGRGHLTTDADVLAATAIDGRIPKVALVIDVDECYVHCAKALRRSAIWDPATWPEDDRRPEPAAIMVGHLDIDVEPEVVAADLEIAYGHTLWTAGGDDRDEPAT